MFLQMAFPHAPIFSDRCLLAFWLDTLVIVEMNVPAKQSISLFKGLNFVA